MNKEVEIISWFASQSRLSPGDYPIGIGDDMAQIQLADGTSVLITTDMLLEGTHFDLAQATIEQVGYKAMAVNLSDCAAMATLPIGAVCSVGLPRRFGTDELRQLHKGVTGAADRYNCPLIGGDITRWSADAPALAMSISMLSRPVNCRPLRRSGAKPGDVICVTGALGGSSKGRHLTFVPRIAEALAITQLAHVDAMIDISDGLSTDLNHICRLSGVGARVEAKLVPVSPDASKTPDPLSAALNDGEDFELLFTLAPTEWETLRKGWRLTTPLTYVGVMTGDRSVVLVSADGSEAELVPAGYDHLSQ